MSVPISFNFQDQPAAPFTKFSIPYIPLTHCHLNMSIRSPVAVRGVPPRLSNWKLCHGSADTHVLLRHGTDSSNQAQLPPLRLQPWLRLLLLLVFRTTLKRHRRLARDRTREGPALPVFVTKPQKNSDNPPRGVSPPVLSRTLKSRR